MDQQTSIDLDNAIIYAFRWNLKDGAFITTRQLIDDNIAIQAALYRSRQRGVHYGEEEEGDFLDYRIRRLLQKENGVLGGLFHSLPSNRPFTITQEWVGPFVVNGWKQKKKLRAWVKKERDLDEILRERGDKAEQAIRMMHRS